MKQHLSQESKYHFPYFFPLVLPSEKYLSL